MNDTLTATPTSPHQYVALGILSILVVLTILPANPAALLLGVLVLAIGVFAYRLGNHLVAVITGAFLFRFAIIIGDTVVGVLPTPPIMYGHHRRASDLAAAWANGDVFSGLATITNMRALVAHLLAPFYVVLGESMLVGRIAIAAFSLLVGYLVFAIAQRVVDRQTSTIAAGLVLFWPTIVYRSVVIQREIILVIVMLMFLWAAVQWLDAITLQTVTVALLATAATFALREENLVLIVAVVGFVSLVKSRDKPFYLAGLTLISVPFIVFFALNFGAFTGHGSTLSPAALESFAYGRAHGDAVYLMGLHYDTWLDVILYAPIKILYFLYTPFPWHIQSIIELFVGMSALALLAATFFARRGIAMLHDKPYYLGLLLSYFLTGVVTYSIIEMNYGAAVRRRIQFIPILLLLAVVGLSKVEVDVRWPTR